jgi:hypothetical protein
VSKITISDTKSTNDPKITNDSQLTRTRSTTYSHGKPSRGHSKKKDDKGKSPEHGDGKLAKEKKKRNSGPKEGVSERKKKEKEAEEMESIRDLLFYESGDEDDFMAGEDEPEMENSEEESSDGSPGRMKGEKPGMLVRGRRKRRDQRVRSKGGLRDDRRTIEGG